LTVMLQINLTGATAWHRSCVFPIGDTDRTGTSPRFKPAQMLFGANSNERL
jgi:hypothetical protein